MPAAMQPLLFFFFPLLLLLCCSDCLFLSLSLPISINTQSSRAAPPSPRQEERPDPCPPPVLLASSSASLALPPYHSLLVVVGMASFASWTETEDKKFESALAIYDQDTPDRWEKVAAMVGGGKSAADVKRHYELLVEDIERIESGDVPFPNYRTTTNAARSANNHRYANGN